MTEDKYNARVIEDRSTFDVKLQVRRGDGIAAALTFNSSTALREGDASTNTMLQGNETEINSFLQSMMDLAYARGLRPSNVESDRDVRAHLADMRKLVFMRATDVAIVDTARLEQDDG